MYRMNEFLVYVVCEGRIHPDETSDPAPKMSRIRDPLK